MQGVIVRAYPWRVNDRVDTPRFRDRLLRDGAGDLVVAVTYVGAYLFAPWLSDSVLLALVVAVALQFFVVTMVVCAITPRGVRGVFWSVTGHLSILALLLWVASAGGQQRPDLLAVGMAQQPLVLRSLGRLARPPGREALWWLEAIGPFLLLMPVLAVTAALAAILPDLGLAARTLRFEHLAPLEPDQLKMALLGGAVYFSVYAVARTAWESLGGDEHRRADLDAATIARWRADYQKKK